MGFSNHIIELIKNLYAYQQATVKTTHGLTYSLLVSLTSTDDVVLRHTLPVFTGLRRSPIVSWDFAGAVSIFGPNALPVVHQ